MIKVKICGMTNIKDALTAIDYGADAVGFLVGQVHYSTGVFIEPEKTREIIRQLPPFCSTVLVTHLSRPKDIIAVAQETTVNTIQLHGDTSPTEAKEIKEKLPCVKTYKVIHVFDEKAITEAKTYEGCTDGIVLDTAIKETGQVGGTGKTHDWKISRKLVETVKLPVILAGGLNQKTLKKRFELSGHTQ
ncbi:MAG: phosphoribosylanthranilate isomerase [Patescibacteria group bacterium]|jgi:phosphoribosylanthranilate isomerase